MSSMHTTTDEAAAELAPIAFGPGEGEALWFLGTLGLLKATSDTTAGRVAVIEQLAPMGSGSPLHVHHNEDEWFYVIDGELTFWVGGQVISAPAGSFVYGPRDIPHTFMVSSEQARFLLVTEPAGFEGFMRACSEPADPPGDSARADDAAGHERDGRARGAAWHRDPRTARDPELNSLRWG